MTFRIFITLGLAASLMVGCSGKTDTNNSSDQRAPVVVRTGAVEQADFPVTVRVGGTLLGIQQTAIPAKLATTVIKIPVRVGQSVRKDDPLVMLDPGGVQSQYNQSKAVFQNAEKQWNKMQALYKSGAISESQYDGAKTEYEVAKANFNSARESVEIDAPFDGVVTDIPVRVGDDVSLGMQLVEVADIKQLRLILDVPTSQVGQLKSGQAVSVRSPVDSTRTMSGTVYSVADAADRATRSFEVECRFPNPVAGFSTGTYVIAEITTKILNSALIVPNDALLYRSGKAIIYAIKNDTAQMVDLSVLAMGQGKSAVSGDLVNGQRVVVVGQKNLTPGTYVREAD
jgi:RND family efflux transporter MFP subunit